MKTLLIKLLILLLPFLAFFGFLEYRLSKIANTYNLKKAYLQSQLKDIEVMNTGSSHAVGINPDFISFKAFNLFNMTQDFYYDVKLSEQYIDKMPRLKLLIIPISHFSFEYNLGQSPEAWREYFYLRFWGIPPQNWDYLMDMRTYSYVALYGKGEVNAFILNRFKDKNPQKLKRNGLFSWSFDVIKDGSNTDIPAKKRLDYFDSVMHPENIPYNLQLLESLLKDCADHHIAVVFITTPTYSSYYNQMDKGEYQSMLDNINFLSSRYNVPYYNYFKDPRFNASDFLDIDHLNPTGAIKFTKILNQEVVRKIIH
jgi:hypothetical protein